MLKFFNLFLIRKNHELKHGFYGFNTFYRIYSIRPEYKKNRSNFVQNLNFQNSLIISLKTNKYKENFEF
jgi:hypothetical protein